MEDFREQRACIKFCFKLGKTATECYEMLKTAFGEQAMGRSHEGCKCPLRTYRLYPAGNTSGTHFLFHPRRCHWNFSFT